MKELTELQKTAIEEIMNATDEQVEEAYFLWKQPQRIKIGDLGHALFAALRSGLIPNVGEVYDQECIGRFIQAYQEQKSSKGFTVSKAEFSIVQNTPDALYYSEEFLNENTNKTADNSRKNRKYYIKYIPEILLGIAFGILFSHFFLGF